MFALNAVGWGLTLTGEHAEAVISCRQALALAEEAGDRNAQAMILDSIALAEHHLGHYGTAIDCYRRLLTSSGSWPALGERDPPSPAWPTPRSLPEA